MTIRNPFVYEINIRTWIRQFGKQAKLADIPKHVWKTFKDQGMDYIWLMGVWQTTPESIPLHCFHPDLVQAYNRAAPGWTRADIGGSPYAIEDYHVDPSFGTNDDLKALRSILHQAGLKLILDFIPNHFNAHSQLISRYPTVFLQAHEHQFQEDPHTIFQRNGSYFAHGKDPYFPAWTDTAQINYFHPDAHAFMLDRIQRVAELCDGVRCDMAMLILPDIFLKTWHQVLSPVDAPTAFWLKAIPAIKRIYEDFIFIAEAYWDTQWRLQQMGFDFTYDKRLLDVLKVTDLDALDAHLNADVTYQQKSVRFLENHDEDRSLLELGEQPSRAASVIQATIPGMKLYYHGQFEGRRLRLPVQMTADHGEPKCSCTVLVDPPTGVYCACQRNHYNKLLHLASLDVVKEGTWQRLAILEHHRQGLLAWRLSNQKDELLVLINYTAHFRQISIAHDREKPVVVDDILNSQNNPDYVDLNQQGRISVSLPAYKAVALRTKYQI